MRELFVVLFLVATFFLTKKDTALQFHLKSGKSLGPKGDLFAFRLIRLTLTLGILHILLVDGWKIVSHANSIVLVTVLGFVGILAVIYEVCSL
jgi:hypothetical protein